MGTEFHELFNSSPFKQLKEKKEDKIYKTKALRLLNIRQQRLAIPERWEMLK